MRTKTSNIVKVMTVLFTFHLSLFTSTAQGWPQDYGGVMLQRHAVDTLGEAG